MIRGVGFKNRHKNNLMSLGELERWAREDTHVTVLTPVKNYDKPEKAYAWARKQLEGHHLHRLFFPENEDRCIQVVISKIAEDNGERVGYSLEMLDITED